MTTDKTQYARGEMVKIKIANNLDVPVWYIGYSQQDLVFWEIEKAQGNNWAGLTIRLPMIDDGREVCRLILYERPVSNIT
ncbi:MAG: hypothetical protein NC238_08815 [Dehalobacter sp.]|nr:hypothetical protein [Dehalobacter sp.]